MKKRTVLEKLKVVEGLTELVVPPQKVSFSMEEAELVADVNGDRHPLTREAYDRAMRMIGMGDTAYLKRTPPGLFLDHLNYHFGEKPRLDAVRLLLNDEGTALYFTRGSISLFSTRQVVNAMTRVLGEELDWDIKSLTLDDIRLSAVLPHESQPRKGDPWKGGVTYTASQVTGRPPVIEAFLLRLVCTNGMVAPESLQRFSWRSDTGEFEEWVEESTSRAYEIVGAKMDKVRVLTQITFDGHTSEALASIFDRYGLSQATRDQVLKTIIDQGGDTMYDVLNAMTFVASHGEGIADNPLRARKLMAAGGDLVEHAVCPECRQVLPTG